VADLAVDDVAEQPPGLAVELHQLHLFDRKVIIRASVGLDARQHHVGREIPEIGGLLHDVRARQVIPALLHLVAFHELVRPLDRLGRAAGVVVGDEGDLAAVDAAFRVARACKLGLFRRTKQHC